ncbi:GumC family protein [Phenylobacterium sp.]|uniref:GumC family protein n=1 Tax=Phenylobacterium sp. TaxID=1871053 RepID=UPI002736FE4E|nr:GumC family protein [Phenylobacterium sp.]MDP3660261.1 GumC family protein [Phenylobacterium sp.]
MAAPAAWNLKGPDATSGSEWASRPRYVVSDIPTLLWRERGLMLVVFAVIFALGLMAAFSMKTRYPAYSSVLVRLGQEYVYEPRAGDAGRGAVPDSDQVIQSETEILSSAHLKQRVIERLGLAYIDPKLAERYASAGPADKREISGIALRELQSGFKVETAPDTPIIRVSFTHQKPEVAARVLNTLLEEYLIYRRAVLSETDSPALEQQRQSFEQKLAAADSAYEQFLNNNRIGDFVAEKTSLSQLQAQIEQQKYQTDAQLQDRLGRLAALNGQLAALTPEVGLFHDINPAAADKLVQLKVQREDLLARYKPNARPVQELDYQIAQLQMAIGAGRTSGESARRVGVNPVYQTVQTDKIQLAAESAALRQASEALARQIQQVTDRRIKLAGLEPAFQELSLDRDVLQANVRDFTVREQQSRAAQEIQAFSNDNIRIVERALPPTKGTSLKKPVAILSLLFAGFTALCAGLLRAFLRPGLPTPRSAARTLDLPVLGAASLKPRTA